MRSLEGEQVLMRIFISESDRWENRPLHKALVELFRKEGFAGATVLRGVAGFGATSVLHTDSLLCLSQELPLVIEVVDNEEKVEGILPRLDNMLQGGMVTMEKARVIRYQK
jgi:PII-like signaling protein